MRLTKLKGKVDFGIITIRQDEFEAVLERFPKAGRVSGRRQYNLRRVELVGGGSYLVAVLRCLEQGNGEAQSAAQDLLEELNPRWLLVVGIAGGVPSGELGLGDVVVSTRIHDFSVEAVLHEKGTEYALAGGPVDKDAAALAVNFPAMKAELGDWSTAGSIAVERPAVPKRESLESGHGLYGDEDWRDKVRQALGHHARRNQPRVVAGGIASSDRLIKNTDILKVWMKMARQILAIEMESAGVYRATYGRHVPTLSIRGISDLVGLERDPAWTRYACHTAAAFALALLRTRPFEPGGTRQRVLPEYADEASRKLSEQIAAARERKAQLQAKGADTSSVEQEILGLRRQLREGGQLREGDSLGDGRYLLLRRIGQGGFATVWEAHDETEDRCVAIKVLHSDLARDPTRRERFFRGARVMSELAHAAIVKVLEPQGHDGGFYYFVMELISGGDFRAAVLKGKISSEAVIPLVLQVGEALALAHQRKFVHRDIKPANILLDAEGNPRLTDFDLVGGFDTTGGTRTGALGTFLYAAPELMDRPQDADARADVYGLGMTALFGLYGREFSVDVLQDTHKKKLIGRLSCNTEVKKVLQRAVSRAQEDRYPDASKFCRALEKAQESLIAERRAVAVEVLRAERAPIRDVVVHAQASQLIPSKPLREAGENLKAVVAFPNLRAAARAAAQPNRFESAPEAQWIHLPMSAQGEPLFAVRAPMEMGKQSRQPFREGDWLVMRAQPAGGRGSLDGDVALVESHPRGGEYTLAVHKKGEWLIPQGSSFRRLPVGGATAVIPLALLFEVIPPERIGPMRGAQLAPGAMMEAFGVHGAPKTGRHGGFLFLCISEKGALLEPDRIGIFIEDRRPEDTAFVLTTQEPRRAWRYWGVARWLADEKCWSLPRPVDFATWRHLGHGRSSSNRLPARTEKRARLWIDQFLRHHPPKTLLERDGKRCLVLGLAPKGGIRISGGKGGFKERTVSLTDLGWVLLARDDARNAGEPLDEARVNRLRYLEGTPKGSTRFIDTGWALFLLQNA